MDGALSVRLIRRPRYPAKAHGSFVALVLSNAAEELERLAPHPRRLTRGGPHSWTLVAMLIRPPLLLTRAGTPLAPHPPAVVRREEIMTRAAVVVACVGVLCLTSAIAVQAKPIRITGGSLIFPTGELLQSGSLSVVGTQGFSMQGGVPTDQTNVDPVHECSMACAPGSTIPVGVDVLGSGFNGTATLDGKTYPDVNGQLSLNNVRLTLTGTADLPALEAAPVTVHAPVTATGTFFLREVAPPLSVPIDGRAIFTMNLAPGPPGSGYWHLLNARYDFIATQTPEPATLLLVGGGVLAAIRARKPRAESSS